MLARMGFLAVVMAGSLSACSVVDTMQGATASSVSSAGQTAAAVSRNYDIARFTFGAPEDINISEAGGYYPFADVVWRGDPPGDRIEQIAAMFNTAVERNENTIVGPRPVNIEVSLVRFHGVTERTRFSVGGVYNIIFNLTVRDAQTGEVIEPSRRVVANLDAPGGVQALILEQRGQTEKVRVTNFLTRVIYQELTPSGTSAT